MSINDTLVALTPIDVVPARPVRSKRVLDVAAAVVLLVLVAPVIGVLALYLRRSGPVFFRQVRVGSGGRHIRITKLRTMSADAEERLAADPDLYERYRANGYKLPAESDPRITGIGRVLRATSLDELPQLVSVIRGDLSMVGPRPVVPAELEEYRVRGAERAYLSVKPGLTGLWQVSGRSSVSYDQRVELDLAYVQQCSVRTDVAIMARTVTAVARRRGAH